jgi:UDP-N-acetyl-2-amino-2-deoxyglucuronate dehydrogenase
MNFAIIGCGRIGHTHARLMQERGNLVAVCDNNLENATLLSRNVGCNAYHDYTRMLDAHQEVDLVSVCTPNGLHAEHSIGSLKRGVHVLCEKPMAIKTTDCEEMIKAADAAAKHLFIVKQNRYNPPIIALKNLIEQGKLGKVYSLQINCFWNRNAEYYHNSWKGTSELDGGTLFTQFSHFVDLLYWIMGDVTDVQAVTDNFGHRGMIDFEDTGAAILRFVGGAIATINYTVNSFRKNMEGSITVFGEKGTVKVGGQYLNLLEYQEIEDCVISNLPKGNTSNNYGIYQGSMSNHDKVFDNIIDVLQNGGKMMTTPFEALKTVEIISRIYESAKRIG